MKLVDIADLKSAALGRAGSIPARGTKVLLAKNTLALCRLTHLCFILLPAFRLLPTNQTYRRAFQAASLSRSPYRDQLL